MCHELSNVNYHSCDGKVFKRVHHYDQYGTLCIGQFEIILTCTSSLVCQVYVNLYVKSLSVRYHRHQITVHLISSN